MSDDTSQDGENKAACINKLFHLLCDKIYINKTGSAIL